MFEVSESLDKNWSREKILSKVKNGERVEKIVSEFLRENKRDLNKFAELINIDNYYILDDLISLSKCELELLKGIKNLDSNKIIPLKKQSLHLKRSYSFQYEFSSFMNTWSNKFVIMALITISLISLTKQAWA
tara:strand:- start:1736 stop:2134 length:399 start_codon:yes stop_codon:yes gene_type:complete